MSSWIYFPISRCAGGSLSESVCVRLCPSAAVWQLTLSSQTQYCSAAHRSSFNVTFVHKCVFYELSMGRSSVVNSSCVCVWEVNWIKNWCIFSSAHNRSAVQIFSLMIPASIHSNIAVGPANFPCFLVSCFSFFFLSLCLLKMGEGWGCWHWWLLQDFVVWFCLVLRCTNLYMYHFRFMAHRISVLIENASIIGLFMCIIIERISVVMNIPFNRYQGCNWFHSYTVLKY